MIIRKFLFTAFWVIAVSASWGLDRVGYVSAKQGLILREKPDQKAKKVALIPFAEEVQIPDYSEAPQIFLAGTYGTWRQIIWREKTGWAFDGFVFFCSFDTVREKAAELTRAYGQEWLKNVPELANNLKVVQLTTATAKDVKIASILGNLVVVDIPVFESEEGKISRRAQLLRYDETAGNLTAIDFENPRGSDRIELLHLNNGKAVDAIHLFEYSDILHVSVFIGENPANAPFKTLLVTPYKIRGIGQCDKTSFEGKYYDNPNSGGNIENKISRWSFNCKTDKLERAR